VAEISRGKKTLGGVVGLAAASLLCAVVMRWEGEALTTYKDPVGIDTVCYGETDPDYAVPGAAYSSLECLKMLETSLIGYAEPVLKCTPGLEGHPHQLAAAVSLAYNIGPSAYCKSTAARLFNSGDWPGACAAFEMWTRAGGRELRGLVNRRRDERRLCETDLPPDKGGRP
jgi:lysozyme